VIAREYGFLSWPRPGGLHPGRWPLDAFPLWPNRSYNMKIAPQGLVAVHQTTSAGQVLGPEIRGLATPAASQAPTDEEGLASRHLHARRCPPGLRGVEAWLSQRWGLFEAHGRMPLAAWRSGRIRSRAAVRGESRTMTRSGCRPYFVATPETGRCAKATNCNTLFAPGRAGRAAIVQLLLEAGRRPPARANDRGLDSANTRPPTANQVEVAAAAYRRRVAFARCQCVWAMAATPLVSRASSGGTVKSPICLAAHAVGGCRPNSGASPPGFGPRRPGFAVPFQPEWFRCDPRPEAGNAASTAAIPGFPTLAAIQ